MKVIATDVSKKYNLRLKELHRVANPGEIFEVTEDRFVYLNGNNPRGYKVVEWYQEPEEVVVPEEEPIPLMASAAAIELDDGTIIENPTFEMFTEVISEEDPVEVEPKPVVEKPKKTTKKKSTKKKVEEKAE